MLNNFLKEQEEKRKDCILCMEALGISQNIIEAFRKKQLFVSSMSARKVEPVDYALQMSVKQIENEYGVMVYHVIETRTKFGDMFAMLCIPDDKNERKENAEFCKSHSPFAYVLNSDNPQFSEFGTICAWPDNGGLTRKY